MKYSYEYELLLSAGSRTIEISHLGELEADVQYSSHPPLAFPVLVDVSLAHGPRRIHNENHVLPHDANRMNYRDLL